MKVQLTFHLTIIDFNCHLSKDWDEFTTVGLQLEVRILQTVDVFLLSNLLISHLGNHSVCSTCVEFHLHRNSVYGHVLDDRFTRLTLESKQRIHAIILILGVLVLLIYVMSSLCGPSLTHSGPAHFHNVPPFLARMANSVFEPTLCG